MASKIKVKSYYIDLYKKEVSFILGGSEKEAKEYFLKNYGYDLNSEEFDGIAIEFVKNGLRKYYVWARFKTNYPVISHECLHVAMYILEAVGFKLDYDNPEPLNYLHEHIFNLALKK